MHLLHCTRFRCIRSYIKDPSHGFFASRWLVHSRFMALGNLLEVVVHYLLVWGIVGLGYWDEFPVTSTLVCMVTHWIIFAVSHDLRLSSYHDFTKLFHCVISQLWENIELVLKLEVSLSYGWDLKLIIYALWIGSLLMKANSNRYSE